MSYQMGLKTKNFCDCGKRISKFSNECGSCHKAKMDALHAKARAIVAKGNCPECGGKLRRNLALAGWYQCEQLGAVDFRKDSTKPECNFQTFTE